MPRAEGPVTITPPWRFAAPCSCRRGRHHVPTEFVGRDRRALVIQAAAVAEAAAQECETEKGRVGWSMLAKGLLVALEILLPAPTYGRPAGH